MAGRMPAAWPPSHPRTGRACDGPEPERGSPERVAGGPVAGPVVAGAVVAGAVVAGAVGGSAGEDGTVPALVADAPAGCRAHWRSRGIDANSRASMAPTVMMTSTTSGVRTMDS